MDFNNSCFVKILFCFHCNRTYVSDNDWGSAYKRGLDLEVRWHPFFDVTTLGTGWAHHWPGWGLRHDGVRYRLSIKRRTVLDAEVFPLWFDLLGKLKSEASSEEPVSARLLNNRCDVMFCCTVGEHSRALVFALLNAALYSSSIALSVVYIFGTLWLYVQVFNIAIFILILLK